MATLAAEQHTRQTAASVRPSARPPAAIRAFVAVLAVGAALFNVGLMLSDRAPGLTKRIFGDFAVRLSNRLNGSDRLDALTDGRTPGNDDIVHIGVWAVAMLLAGLAVWRWSALVLAAAMVFAASVFIEVAQGRYSTTRAVEMSDISANALGVGLGTAVAAGCYLVWSALASMASAARRS